MAGGLDPATTARLIIRHGSLDAALRNARRNHPRLDRAFREIIARQLTTLGHGQGAENAAATADLWHLVAECDRLDDETPAPTPAPAPAPRAGRGPKRTGKTYPAETAAAVVRRVLSAQPSRELRDEVHRELSATMPAATTTLIECVLKRMDGKRLSATRRKRWVRAADKLANDGTVTLDELEKRLT